MKINHKLITEIPYDQMDPEVIKLCKAINALPSLNTYLSCCGHGQTPFRIWFHLDKNIQNLQGLFFLTRCCDKRYWKYGDEWSISLSISDTYESEGRYPVNFMLQSKARGEKAYAQAKDLYENMIYHLNHKNFLKLFEIDLSKFNLKPEKEDPFNV